MATTIIKKKFPHISKSQKKTVKHSGKTYTANYQKDKDLFEKLNIPASKKEVIVVITEKPQGAKPKRTLKQKLETLDLKVLSEKESKIQKPFQFKEPVPPSRHQPILKKIKNNLFAIKEDELASIIGCSKRTISSVINGNQPFKRNIDNFNQLVKLVNLLLSIFKEDYLCEWIRKPEKELKNKKPLDLLKSGNHDQIFHWAYMELEGQYK